MGEPEKLIVRCGNAGRIQGDVDAFSRFYAERFRDEALAGFVGRMRRQSLAAAVPLLAAGALLGIPLLINARSVFAYLLLAMGGVLGALGLFFLVRAIRAPSFCARRLDRLLAADFEASRSETKRVFDLIIDGEGVEARFGVTSGVPQRRRLRWDQVRGVYLADGLVFVRGLTWVCRASTPPDAYDALVAELRRRMPPDLVVEVGAARLSD